jgi:hypothetical protein
MADDKKQYIDAKVLEWWRDFDFNEYLAILEVNGEWRLVTTKVEEPNG